MRIKYSLRAMYMVRMTNSLSSRKSRQTRRQMFQRSWGGTWERICVDSSLGRLGSKTQGALVFGEVAWLLGCSILHLVRVDVVVLEPER